MKYQLSILDAWCKVGKSLSFLFVFSFSFFLLLKLFQSLYFSSENLNCWEERNFIFLKNPKINAKNCVIAETLILPILQWNQWQQVFLKMIQFDENTFFYKNNFFCSTKTIKRWHAIFLLHFWKQLHQQRRELALY